PSHLCAHCAGATISHTRCNRGPVGTDVTQDRFEPLLGEIRFRDRENLIVERPKDILLRRAGSQRSGLEGAIMNVFKWEMHKSDEGTAGIEVLLAQLRQHRT